jgi:hypothetical protein
VFGKNVDKTKVEIKVRAEHFLNKAFQKFHITIWSYMKLEDVLEIFPMLMFESFLNWFFSFGDVNNAPKHLVKFHPGPIIT